MKNIKFMFLSICLLILMGLGSYILSVHSSLVEIANTTQDTIDHEIEIEALTSPWVFNITKIDGAPVDASKYVSGVFTTLELEVGLTYRINITSVDVTMGISVSGLTDYLGNAIDVSLPFQTTKSIIIAPTEPGSYTYRCTVFCGSGHGDMKGSIIVSQSTSSNTSTDSTTSSTTSSIVSTPTTTSTSETILTSEDSGSVSAPIAVFFLVTLGILGTIRIRRKKNMQ
ncbi:MAG: hypothetical protein ACFFCQ_05490 [Promethearchaeota archaeon]